MMADGENLYMIFDRRLYQFNDMGQVQKSTYVNEDIHFLRVLLYLAIDGKIYFAQHGRPPYEEDPYAKFGSAILGADDPVTQVYCFDVSQFTSPKLFKSLDPNA
jgi:hypothetical protein